MSKSEKDKVFPDVNIYSVKVHFGHMTSSIFNKISIWAAQNYKKNQHKTNSKLLQSLKKLQNVKKEKNLLNFSFHQLQISFLSGGGAPCWSRL